MILSKATLKLAEVLKGLRYGVTTEAGSITTLVDSNMNEPDNFFNNGTIFFTSGALAGKTAVITDYDETTFTFTFATQTVAPGLGSRYAVLQAVYTREALVAGINQAITTINPLPKITDDATFITVANQEEYTLPSGVSNIKKVEIATSLTSPYSFSENSGWFEVNGTLYFDMEIPATSGYQIRLYHETDHASVNADADEISEVIHPDLLTWTAAHYCVLTRSGYSENDEPYTKEMIGLTQQKMLQMQKHAPKRFRKTSRPSGW